MMVQKKKEPAHSQCKVHAALGTCIIINGKYSALPTMNITSESKPNLVELKLTTLQILSAASGVDAKVLFERIDFVITDQTRTQYRC